MREAADVDHGARQRFRIFGEKKSYSLGDIVAGRVPAGGSAGAIPSHSFNVATDAANPFR